MLTVQYVELLFIAVDLCINAHIFGLTAPIVCQAAQRQHHSVDLLKDLHWLPTCAWQNWLQDCHPLLQSRQTTTAFVSYSSSTNIAARRFSCCAPPFGTVFPHSYTLLTVSLVLGLNSRLTCSQNICSWSAVCTSDTLTRSFAGYKFVTYLIKCALTWFGYWSCKMCLNWLSNVSNVTLLLTHFTSTHGPISLCWWDGQYLKLFALEVVSLLLRSHCCIYGLNWPGCW